MDIDSFISKYGVEWRQLEAACSKGPEGLSSFTGEELDRVVALYLRTSNHLTETRARYFDPQLEAYLNDLVVSSHRAIYADRPTTTRSVRATFGQRYREALRRALPQIGIAGALLVIVTLFMWWWTATSPGARAGLMTPDVRAAVSRAGRAPELGPSPGLASYILVNNVEVAMAAFALGITAGIGTIYILVKNAMMLGSLAGVYTAAGSGAAFWTLILPHGMLELLAIVISAGAGMHIGWALVAPGDRLRSEAIREAAGDSLLVITGAIPAFVIAAAIESFISGTSAPDWLELTVGTVAVLGYSAFAFGPLALKGARNPSR